MTERIQYLLDRNTAKACSKEEMRELYEYIAAAKEGDLHRLMDEQYDKIDPAVIVTGIDWEYMLNQILAAAPVVSMQKHTKYNFWRRIAVAASIILAIGIGYFVISKRSEKSQPVATIPSKDVKAPTSNRAMITLANGQKVYLDSASNGTLAQQGNIKLVKLANGQIAYQTATGEIIKEIQYNTLSNPRGSKVIDMQLADGSHVWLNAGSSLRYPVAFAGDKRTVEITGEAYFEVSHDASKPFIVSKGETSVQVLGTHFNVNAYDDESDIKVTLLEGSVKINNSVIIKPGQQAVVSNDIKVQNGVDVDEVMAWKNGKFQFNDASIETIMKQVGRWYDAEVVYEGTIPGNFVADISREVPVSKLLHILELTNKVHFKIENKKIIVMK